MADLHLSSLGILVIEAICYMFYAKTNNETGITIKQESVIKCKNIQITSPMKKGIASKEQINEIHLKFPAWISDVNKLFLESRRLSRIFLSKAYRNKWL